METIIVRVEKRITHRHTRGHRTSNGWESDDCEVTEPIVWLSKPIIFEYDISVLIAYCLHRFSTQEITEGAQWLPDDSTVFEPNWTEEIVHALNFSHCVKFTYFEADCNDGSFINAFQLDMTHFPSKGPFFVGLTPPHKWWYKFVLPFSPFRSIEMLKGGIYLMAQTGNIIPDSWLEYLFENSTEDLSSFLKDCGISLKSGEFKICQSNGELFPCLVNVQEGLVLEYKQNKPSLSYDDAWQKDNDTIADWYEKYGASSIDRLSHRSSRSFGYGSSYGQDEMDSWPEDWRWNID